MESKSAKTTGFEASSAPTPEAIGTIGATLGQLALESIGIVEVRSSVEALNFERYHQKLDLRLLIIDGDNTVFPHDEELAPASTTQKLHDIREQGYVEEIALVSNNPDLDLAKSRATAIKADTVAVPASITDMKPGSTLVRQAIKERGARPEVTIGVGDGVTDYLAYLKTGIPTAIVDGYGPQDARGYPMRSAIRHLQGPLRSKLKRLFE